MIGISYLRRVVVTIFVVLLSRSKFRIITHRHLLQRVYRFDFQRDTEWWTKAIPLCKLLKPPTVPSMKVSGRAARFAMATTPL